MSCIFLLISSTLNAQTIDDKIYSVLGEEVQEIFPDSIRAYTFLEKTIEVFKDESGDASFEEVAANKQWFTPNNIRGNLDAEAIYWMKLNLQVGADFRDTCAFNIQYYVSLYSWAKIDAYLVHEDGRMEQQRAGTELKRIDKSIAVNGNVFAFGFTPGERAQLYVRVEGGRPQLAPPTLLCMWTRRLDSLSQLKYIEGYRGGTYRFEYDYAPFRFNRVLEFDLLEAPSNAITLEEILDEEKEVVWEENYRNIAPEKGKVYWLHTQLIGNETFNGEHIFTVSPWGNDGFAYDYMDVYIAKKGDEFEHQRTGNAVPTHERPYDFWANLFKVELQVSYTIDLYIRLEGMNRYRPMPFFNILHIDPSSIFPRQVTEARKSMFLIGAMAMQFVFFLCLFLIERERIHFYFSIFILGAILISATGEPPFVSFAPFPMLHSYDMHINIIMTSLFVIATLKFFEIYFNYPADSFYSKWFIPGIILIELCLFTILMVLPNPIDPEYPFYTIYHFSKLIQILAVLWLGIAAKRKDLVLKIIFFIGMTPIIVVAALRLIELLLYMLGYTVTTPSPMWFQNFRWAMLFLLTVFSLSIGYRKNLLRREKEDALADNIKAQQTIIEQLEETARLEKRDELKTRFFTNISHEFRTPLTVILGMNRQKDNPKAQDLIERNGKKLLGLINQLLDLSKIDTGHLKVNYQQIEIVSFTQYIGESFQSLADRKYIRLTIYSEIKELYMDMDEEKYRQIISNLLSNAIKFTRESGKIILHLVQHNDQLLVKVTDNGHGIETAQLPHVFDRFYQVENAQSKQGEGTGIGLALVKELVQLLDGRIEVESKISVGTTFSLQFPISRTSPRKLETYEDKNIDYSIAEDIEVLQLEASSDLPRLLIIEDNADVVIYIQSLLSTQYELLIANNGEEGIQKAIEHTPDIIISDVMMPKKNGFEVVETLKQDIRTSHIPIILLTAKATQEDKIEGLKYGADAYLMKPFNKEELLIRLKNLVEVRQQLQQKYAKGITTLSDSSTPLSIEEQFLLDVRQQIEANYAKVDFNVEALAASLHMSRVQLFRKLKAVTDQTPSQMIRDFRLEKAKTLLQNKQFNISEIAYELGFSDPNYFTRQFTKAYKQSPNAYRKSL